MIISEDSALERLASTDNLINRLSSLAAKASVNANNGKSKALSLFVDRDDLSTRDELQEDNIPSIDNLIANATEQIETASIEKKAVKILESALDELTIRLPDIRADKLPAIITSTSKMISDMRRDAVESVNKKRDANVHLHFYAPEQKKLADYDFIDVG